MINGILFFLIIFFGLCICTFIIYRIIMDIKRTASEIREIKEKRKEEGRSDDA